MARYTINFNDYAECDEQEFADFFFGIYEKLITCTDLADDEDAEYDALDNKLIEGEWKTPIKRSDLEALKEICRGWYDENMITVYFPEIGAGINVNDGDDIAFSENFPVDWVE